MQGWTMPLDNDSMFQSAMCEGFCVHICQLSKRAHPCWTEEFFKKEIIKKSAGVNGNGEKPFKAEIFSECL